MKNTNDLNKKISVVENGLSSSQLDAFEQLQIQGGGKPTCHPYCINYWPPCPNHCVIYFVDDGQIGGDTK